MTLQLIRKPPTKKGFNERLKITLDQHHRFNDKISMLLETMFWLQEKHGFHYAGSTDVYFGLVDQYGHPLTFDLIEDWNILVKNPYPCAADAYRV